MLRSVTPRSAAAAVKCSPIPSKAGIGLRFPHHRIVRDTKPDVAWWEVHTENYMGGGAPLAYLDAIRSDYPISLHGVGLSLGGADDLDANHLSRVRDVVARVQPGLVSEHLSWCSAENVYFADLLPLPMTEEALETVCRHVDETQTRLNHRILLENPSSYLRFAHSTIPEWEFLSEVSRRTGCGILCDVNNVYVSACNHGWNAEHYIDALPIEAVGEIHLAGHAVRQCGDGRILRIDDHGAAVTAEVWALYEHALRRFGAVPSLIEWDTNIPELPVLQAEARKAQSFLDASLTEARHAVFA